MERSSYVAPFLALALVATGVHPSNLGAQDYRDPLRSALAKRIDDARQGTGAVVGLLTPEGRSFAAYGRVSVGGQEPTADTIFEIGSITKVFTAFLLADMVERGEVALDDPVRKYLPTSVMVPSRRGREIWLVDLATHTSGLPRDSVEVDLNSDNNPYAGYASSDLYAFLGSYRLRLTVGVFERRYGTLGARARIASWRQLRRPPASSDLRAARDDEHDNHLRHGAAFSSGDGL